MIEKYRCCRSGMIFNKDEAECGQEYRGEFWGMPAYENVDICPECNSDDLEDFEIPYEECDDYKDCDYDCENCEFKRRMEEEK